MSYSSIHLQIHLGTYLDVDLPTHVLKHFIMFGSFWDLFRPPSRLRKSIPTNPLGEARSVQIFHHPAPALRKPSLANPPALLGQSPDPELKSPDVPDVGKPILAPERRSPDISWGDRLGFRDLSFSNNSAIQKLIFPGIKAPARNVGPNTTAFSGHVFSENKSSCEER